MTDNSREQPTRTGSFRAAVRAGANLTEYTRAGAGRPVLLLLQRDGQDTAYPADILTAISSQFRVIAPERIPNGTEFGQWLSTFLDGLGLDAISIVTEDEFGVPVFGFALLEPARVRRVVVLSKTSPETEAAGAAVANPGVPEGSHPFLIIRYGGPVDQTVHRVVQFLATP